MFFLSTQKTQSFYIGILTKIKILNFSELSVAMTFRFTSTNEKVFRVATFSMDISYGDRTISQSYCRFSVRSRFFFDSMTHSIHQSTCRQLVYSQLFLSTPSSDMSCLYDLNHKLRMMIDNFLGKFLD